MPLDLQPILDLEPVDSLPDRLSPEEFERLPRGDYSITNAQPLGEKGMTEEQRLQVPMISPERARKLIDAVDIPSISDVVAPTLTEGIKQGVADLISGMTSPHGVGKGAEYMIPVYGQGLMALDAGRGLGESAHQLVNAIKEGDTKGAGKAIAGLGGAMLMAKGGAEGLKLPEPKPETFPALPDPDLVARNIAAPGTVRPQEIQAVGLPRAEEAPFSIGEIPFQRVRRFGSMEIPEPQVLPRLGRIEDVPILEELRPKEELETRGKISFGEEASAEKAMQRGMAAPRTREQIATEEAVTQGKDLGLNRSAQEVQNASSQPESTGNAQREIRSRMGEGAPLRQQGEATGVRARETEAPAAPAVQEAKGQVESTIARVESLPTQEAGSLKQRPAVEEGTKLSEADVPALEKARDDAGTRMMQAMEAGQNDVFKAEYGRNIYYSGLIEGARRKGPNYDQFVKEQKGEGLTEILQQLEKIRDRFDASGDMGKTFSLPHPDAFKSVAKSVVYVALDLAIKAVKAGRSLSDALDAAMDHIRKNSTAGFDAVKVRANLDYIVANETRPRDVTGENVKMRQSAERATTAPSIPEPVQQRIETAPESRYKQQSMDRVENEVASMSEPELAAVTPDSEIFTAARLEQAKRLFEAGKNDEGYQVFVDLEKQGTRFGQLINQFKLLKGSRPESVVQLINEKLVRSGRDRLTKDQSDTALGIATRSKQADAALEKATETWRTDPTEANAKAAERALDVSNDAALDLQKFIGRFSPQSVASVLKAVLQGNLLTPISEVANIFGNMSFAPFRAAERGITSALDTIDSYLTGRSREATVQPIAGTVEAAKGLGRGLAKVPELLKRGQGDTIKGETRAGLHPIQAWINQFAKHPETPTTGGKLRLSDRLKLLLEGTLGVPAEAMLRGLGAGDLPFREVAQARLTAEQLRLANVPREQWSFAQKFPELFLSKDALAKIRDDTNRTLFQRNSRSLNLLTNWIRGKGEWFDLAVATVAPYKLTPWNIIGEILNYNPAIALTRGAIEASKGNRLAAKQFAAKAVVGTTITAAGVWLYKNGLLAPSLDERTETQKSRILSGDVLPPNHINVSGLKRKLAGGDPSFKPGDETVDIFRAGGLAGAMFYMVANIGRDIEHAPKGTDLSLSILRQSTLEQARFGLNQSFLQGVEGLLTAIKEGNADNFIKQWANTVTSIPLPNTLTTLSRATREYKPDFKADEFKTEIGNIFRNRLGFAGLDDYLPLKRDLWGQPLPETPKDRNALFYHFFDISKHKQVTSDPVELELYRLWRKTDDSKVIPAIPSRTITVNRDTFELSPDQYGQYVEDVGKWRRTIVDRMAVNPNYHALPDEAKIKMLDRAYYMGAEAGKAEFMQSKPVLKAKPKHAGMNP